MTLKNVYITDNILRFISQKTYTVSTSRTRLRVAAIIGILNTFLKTKEKQLSAIAAIVRMIND